MLESFRKVNFSIKIESEDIFTYIFKIVLLNRGREPIVKSELFQSPNRSEKPAFTFPRHLQDMRDMRDREREIERRERKRERQKEKKRKKD